MAITRIRWWFITPNRRLNERICDCFLDARNASAFLSISNSFRCLAWTHLKFAPKTDSNDVDELKLQCEKSMGKRICCAMRNYIIFLFVVVCFFLVIFRMTIRNTLPSRIVRIRCVSRPDSHISYLTISKLLAVASQSLNRWIQAFESISINSEVFFLQIFVPRWNDLNSRKWKLGILIESSESSSNVNRAERTLTSTWNIIVANVKMWHVDFCNRLTFLESHKTEINCALSGLRMENCEKK